MRRPDRRAHARDPRVGAGRIVSEPEVEKGDLARRLHHHVRGLQVAVDDARGVRGHDGSRELREDPERLFRGNRTLQIDDGSEVAPVDELHRQVRQATRDAVVVKAADVGVADLPVQAHFALESPEDRVPLFPDGSPHDLDRDDLVQLAIDRLEDVADSALAERAQVLVPRQRGEEARAQDAKSGVGALAHAPIMAVQPAEAGGVSVPCGVTMTSSPSSSAQ